MEESPDVCASASEPNGKWMLLAELFSIQIFMLLIYLGNETCVDIFIWTRGKVAFQNIKAVFT